MIGMRISEPTTPPSFPSPCVCASERYDGMDRRILIFIIWISSCMYTSCSLPGGTNTLFFFSLSLTSLPPHNFPRRIWTDARIASLRDSISLLVVWDLVVLRKKKMINFGASRAWEEEKEEGVGAVPKNRPAYSSLCACFVIYVCALALTCPWTFFTHRARKEFKCSPLLCILFCCLLSSYNNALCVSEARLFFSIIFFSFRIVFSVRRSFYLQGFFDYFFFILFFRSVPTRCLIYCATQNMFWRLNKFSNQLKIWTLENTQVWIFFLFFFVQESFWGGSRMHQNRVLFAFFPFVFFPPNLNQPPENNKFLNTI